jgi:TonB family protein
MLKPCAEAAARGWKFTPTILSGNPVKVIGTLTFNFTVGDQPTGGNTTEPGSGAGPGYDAARNGGTLDPSANQTMVDNHPVLLNAPGLHYTELARTNRTEGSVVARVLVGSDGLVKDVRIIRGLPDGLNEEAVRAAYQIRFTPAMKDGEPVPYWQVMEMEFHLR